MQDNSKIDKQFVKYSSWRSKSVLKKPLTEIQNTNFRRGIEGKAYAIINRNNTTLLVSKNEGNVANNENEIPKIRRNDKVAVINKKNMKNIEYRQVRKVVKSLVKEVEQYFYANDFFQPRIKVKKEKITFSEPCHPKKIRRREFCQSDISSTLTKFSKITIQIQGPESSAKTNSITTAGGRVHFKSYQKKVALNSNLSQQKCVLKKDISTKTGAQKVMRSIILKVPVETTLTQIEQADLKKISTAKDVIDAKIVPQNILKSKPSTEKIITLDLPSSTPPKYIAVYSDLSSRKVRLNDTRDTKQLKNVMNGIVSQITNSQFAKDFVKAQNKKQYLKRKAKKLEALKRRKMTEFGKMKNKDDANSGSDSSETSISSLNLICELSQENVLTTKRPRVVPKKYIPDDARPNIKLRGKQRTARLARAIPKHINKRKPWQRHTSTKNKPKKLNHKAITALFDEEISKVKVNNAQKTTNASRLKTKQKVKRRSRGTQSHQIDSMSFLLNKCNLKDRPVSDSINKATFKKDEITLAEKGLAAEKDSLPAQKKGFPSGKEVLTEKESFTDKTVSPPKQIIKEKDILTERELYPEKVAVPEKEIVLEENMLTEESQNTIEYFLTQSQNSLRSSLFMTPPMQRTCFPVTKKTNAFIKHSTNKKKILQTPLAELNKKEQANKAKWMTKHIERSPFRLFDKHKQVDKHKEKDHVLSPARFLDLYAEKKELDSTKPIEKQEENKFVTKEAGDTSQDEDFDLMFSQNEKHEADKSTTDHIPDKLSQRDIIKYGIDTSSTYHKTCNWMAWDLRDDETAVANLTALRHLLKKRSK